MRLVEPAHNVELRSDRHGHAHVVFAFPYRADMDPDLIDVPKVRRLLYKGRVYDIVAATLLSRQEGVEVETLAKPG